MKSSRLYELLVNANATMIAHFATLLGAVMLMASPESPFASPLPQAVAYVLAFAGLAHLSFLVFGVDWKINSPRPRSDIDLAKTYAEARLSNKAYGYRSEIGHKIKLESDRLAMFIQRNLRWMVYPFCLAAGATLIEEYRIPALMTAAFLSLTFLVYGFASGTVMMDTTNPGHKTGATKSVQGYFLGLVGAFKRSLVVSNDLSGNHLLYISPQGTAMYEKLASLLVNPIAIGDGALFFDTTGANGVEQQIRRLAAKFGREADIVVHGRYLEPADPAKLDLSKIAQERKIVIVHAFDLSAKNQRALMAGHMKALRESIKDIVMARNPEGAADLKKPLGGQKDRFMIVLPEFDAYAGEEEGLSRASFAQARAAGLSIVMGIRSEASFRQHAGDFADCILGNTSTKIRAYLDEDGHRFRHDIQFGSEKPQPFYPAFVDAR